MTLDDMPFDKPCHVLGFDESLLDSDPDCGASALRLMEMGFDAGARITKRHGAPFTRDPIAVEIGTHMVAMRRADARLVFVEPEAA